MHANVNHAAVSDALQCKEISEKLAVDQRSRQTSNDKQKLIGRKIHLNEKKPHLNERKFDVLLPKKLNMPKKFINRFEF